MLVELSVWSSVMFRFLSGRKGRDVAPGQRAAPAHKNLLQCRVVLLDGSDLSVELTVCIFVCFISFVGVVCLSQFVVDLNRFLLSR